MAEQVFRVALGEELRQARERGGWSTRRSFLVESGLNMAVQTLGTYELGTRAIGLSQLFTLCRALDLDPIASLDKAYRTAVGSDTDIRVDLVKLARTTTQRLQPLCTWARLRTHDRTADDSTVTTFVTEAVDSMANLCGMDRAEFIHALIQNGIAQSSTVVHGSLAASRNTDHGTDR
jgi:transcriptional regulator with XRE-family HTH domain